MERESSLRNSSRFRKILMPIKRLGQKPKGVSIVWMGCEMSPENANRAREISGIPHSSSFDASVGL